MLSAFCLFQIEREREREVWELELDLHMQLAARERQRYIIPWVWTLYMCRENVLRSGLWGNASLQNNNARYKPTHKRAIENFTTERSHDLFFNSWSLLRIKD